jgi:hypothetical protein
MISRRREKVGAFAVAGVMTLVLGACAGDDAGASQGTTKLANRTLTPAATGGAETGPAETGSPRAPAQAAPDVVERGECSAGARSRLELTDIDRRIKVRFEVRRSPVGHSWHSVLRHFYTGEIGPHNDPPRHARILASESRGFVVLVRVKDQFGPFEDDYIRAKAADTQTGQVCTVEASWY